MSRKRHYLDIDVLTAARDRIRHVYDVFDSVVVMFSGGKDSLVTMHLVKEIAEEYGALPVNVCFRDEELIPDSVIRLVDRYRQEPWVRMLWYALPLWSTMFVLGDVREYVQWDPRREHTREIPPWAITDVPGREGETFSQYDMDQVVAANFRGKVAAVTGIRASESLVRYRASVNKLNENYITASDTGLKGTPGAARKRAPNLMLAKPIYDWDEDDVLQYIWEHQLDYAPAYDAQHLAGVGLRVSTPLHAEAAVTTGASQSQARRAYAAARDLISTDIGGRLPVRYAAQGGAVMDQSTEHTSEKTTKETSHTEVELPKKDDSTGEPAGQDRPGTDNGGGDATGEPSGTDK